MRLPLTPRKVAKATRYNMTKARTTGWAREFGSLMNLFGFDRPPTAEQFANAVASWQDSHPPLGVDGKLGPGTWRRLRSVEQLKPGRASVLPKWLLTPEGGPGDSIDMNNLTGPGPPWLQIAQVELRRWDGLIAGWSRSKANNAEEYTDWDEQYFEAARKWNRIVHGPGVPRGKNRDWCAAFVNWCLHLAGYSHTGSSGAASFATNQWHFKAMDEPKLGCIVVNGDGAGHGTHVSFLWSWSGLPKKPNGKVPANVGRRSMLGGNQRGRVCIKGYSNELLAARDKDGNKSPYLWPADISPDTCRLLLPSARPHSCEHTYTLADILE